MERLTTTSEIIDSATLIALCESCGEDGCDSFCAEYQDKDCKGCPVQEAFEMLKAYEDTGLTPEQIEAQQQEIEQLSHDNGQCADTILALMKENASNSMKVEALTADKDEQAGRIMRLEKLAKDLYFAYINKDPDCPHSFEAKTVERYHALLGGAEG